MKTGIDDIIQHDGIVQKTEAGSVLVRITSLSACAGCHADGACGMYGKEDKLINVPGSYNVRSGDTVTVVMKKSMGYMAVFLSYVLPFFLVIVTLFILTAMSFPELFSGLISIAVLIPYYFIIYVLRKRINQEFTFTLKN